MKACPTQITQGAAARIEVKAAELIKRGRFPAIALTEAARAVLGCDAPAAAAGEGTRNYFRRLGREGL